MAGTRAAGGVLARLTVVAAIFVAALQPSPSSAREVVDLEGEYPYGTVIVKTGERRLYYALGNGRAIRYRVAVGSPRNQWFGESWVSQKRENPGWTPTPNMRRRNPALPRHVAPGPNNPLGVRALYLGWTAYRIHGTNAPGSIGSATSNGCIRMLNEDVLDLYERVHVGAPVVVLK